jgi:peptidoglycan/LPS O-acetylase OafA/YrhL
VCLALSAGFNRSGVFMSVQANAWALLAGVFDYANVRFGLAFMRYDYGASFAWWSLSLEEQFYLVLPPLAFLCGRYLPILLIPVVVLQFGLVRSALLTVFRTDAILLGVLLACWEGHRSFPLIGAQIGRLPAALRIALVAVLLVCLGVLGTLNLSFNRFTLGEIALVSAALVYLAAQNTGLLLGEGALRRLMVAIGARSYALYLVHIPAFFAAREIWFRIGGQHGDLPVALTGAALLLVGAELNWRFVEQPLRARGTRIAAGFVARRTA